MASQFQNPALSPDHRFHTMRPFSSSGVSSIGRPWKLIPGNGSNITSWNSRYVQLGATATWAHPTTTPRSQRESKTSGAAGRCLRLMCPEARSERSVMTPSVPIRDDTDDSTFASSRKGRLPSFRVRDDEGEFSPHRALRPVLAKPRGRPANDLLELLGQLARRDDLDLAEDLPERLERSQDAVRRLVADDRGLEPAECLQPVHAPAGLDGKKPVEHEGIGGDAGRRQGGDHGGGAGHRHHGNARFARLL